MKQILTTLFVSFLSLTIYAQTSSTCEVMVDSLKGTYEGECAGGKANGQGKAVGIHIYEGSFKKGYPDGTGKYTWPNGDYYTGGWKKGQMDGKGEFHDHVGGKEKVKTGFWKKGDYKGEYEKPYIVHNTTTEIGRVQASVIRKEQDTRITIQVENLSSQGGFATTNNASITKLTDIIVKNGTFTYRNSTLLSNKETTVLQGITFPFRATFVFGNSSVDIELFEQGAWDLMIPINK